MRLPGEVGEGMAAMAAMLTRNITVSITDITAIIRTGTKGTGTRGTGRGTGIKGTGIKGTAGTDMPVATRRRSLTGTGTSPQGLGAGSQAIIRASGCARRRRRTALFAYQVG
jgi:hypothetical protein